MKVSLQEALNYIQLPEQERHSAGKTYNLRVLDAVNRALRSHQENADFLNDEIKIFAKSFSNPSEPKSKILRIFANFFSRLQNKLHGLSFLTSKEMSDNILSHYKQPATDLAKYIDRLPDFLQNPENVKHVTEVEEIEDPQENDAFSFSVVFNEEENSFLLHVRYKDSEGRVYRFIGEQISDIDIAIFHRGKQIGKGNLLCSIVDVVKNYLEKSSNEEELTPLNSFALKITGINGEFIYNFPHGITVLEARKRIYRKLAEEGVGNLIGRIRIILNGHVASDSDVMTGMEKILIHFK